MAEAVTVGLVDNLDQISSSDTSVTYTNHLLDDHHMLRINGNGNKCIGINNANIKLLDCNVDNPHQKWKYDQETGTICAYHKEGLEKHFNLKESKIDVWNLCFCGAKPNRMGGNLQLRLVKDMSNVADNFKFDFDEATIRPRRSSQRDYVLGYKEGKTTLLIKKDYWRTNFGTMVVDDL